MTLKENIKKENKELAELYNELVKGGAVPLSGDWIYLSSNIYINKKGEMKTI